jgi:hypothetical protein
MFETGFMIGMANDQIVILRNPKRQAYFASSMNKDYVTDVLPPFVVLPGVPHMEDWFTKQTWTGATP